MNDDDWENLLIIAGGIMMICMAGFRDKEPCRTSVLTGHAYTRELLNGHSIRFQEVVTMQHNTFHCLCYDLRGVGLTDTRGVMVEEQLLTFLYIISEPVGNRNAQERFQHSGETIHRFSIHAIIELICRHFKRVLNSLLLLYQRSVRLPTAHTSLSSRIADNSTFYPYFKDCIGAIDGCHVAVHVPQEQQAAYRNRYQLLSHLLII